VLSARRENELKGVAQECAKAAAVKRGDGDEGVVVAKVGKSLCLIDDDCDGFGDDADRSLIGHSCIVNTNVCTLPCVSLPCPFSLYFYIFLLFPPLFLLPSLSPITLSKVLPFDLASDASSVLTAQGPLAMELWQGNEKHQEPFVDILVNNGKSDRLW
jgi:hypothetical protein